MKPLVIGLVLIAVVAGGVFLYVSKNKTTPTDMTETAQKKANDSNPFTSIQDALSKSLSLECTYTNEEGVETKTYLKAGSVRVVAEGQAAEGMGNVLMKDKKMYMWSNKTKTGFIYTISVPEKMPASKDTNVTISPTEDKDDKEASLLAQIEKYKDACKPSAVDDSFFTVPEDVTFQDMDKMLKGLKIPSGVPSPGQENSEYQKYVEEMMKKISPQP